MLNAERWTMPDGEPVPGIWGEGFIDRRHPHTVVHEVMLTGVRTLAGVRGSVSAGKGIVPFGTDDPMVRPFTKYPANHHFTQILERVLLTAAVQVAPRVTLEAATFNGDEPTSTWSAPRWSRFGDSHAARVTLWPGAGLEMQGSFAAVRSPEFASGDGLDQAKASASARWAPASGSGHYALIEWARTEERYQDRRIIDYGTLLAEGAVRRRGFGAALRYERTSRPEEERLLDPFRTARPPAELTIRGISRFHLLTAQLSTALPMRGHGHAMLFVETSHAAARPLLLPVLLDPAAISGSSRSWHLTAGMRLGAGAMPRRVGRYGVAAGRGGQSGTGGMTHD
jgi:hypothetical protein